ncbi:deoxyribodipyrimidine photo-lyase [Desulforhopalus singaporensis]|uniref:Deoxyribodipyrimidine photo-lyase n=1 Tax=Desulforhopalus singaporensis TaxID=91360 RepID=A0A1H0S431_9BACT|nr:deoxyribodipyrimidine photo-lyase [Desulforhopalus singaporensis]SDP36523.1 Deoxyribodipyrimidine photo-lyase type II [Desulforhopalus singaporensis]
MVLKKNSDLTRRTRWLKEGKRGQGPVVYWMSREIRAEDNWSLLVAQQEAEIRQKPLLVIFFLKPNDPLPLPRTVLFMLQGLAETAAELIASNIGFSFFHESPELFLPHFMQSVDGHLLVCDFNPLKEFKLMQQKLVSSLSCPICEVDSHNIIPAWITSNKKEYGAYTIRPKIHRLLPDFLTEIPPIQPHPYGTCGRKHNDLSILKQHLRCVEKNIPLLLLPGEKAAGRAARNFIRQGLAEYQKHRNDPCRQAQSGLSPYLHFGNLSPQRLALMVRRNLFATDLQDAFLEELIVRRELADNFCLFEPHYDTIDGFPAWGRETLARHQHDRREYIYTLEEFENSSTHDPLWNSCQKDLVLTGKLHGYLRMYWAKKILEWSRRCDDAMRWAIYLNDRYSLDGRDPNGYAGIAWSLGGVHDRAWKERQVFGKVRYMNLNGCKRKFDVNKYIDMVAALS